MLVKLCRVLFAAYVMEKLAALISNTLFGAFPRNGKVDNGLILGGVVVGVCVGIWENITESKKGGGGRV